MSLVACAVLLAACGGGNSTAPDSTAQANAASSQTASPAPVAAATEQDDLAAAPVIEPSASVMNVAFTPGLVDSVNATAADGTAAAIGADAPAAAVDDQRLHALGVGAVKEAPVAVVATASAVTEKKAKSLYARVVYVDATASAQGGDGTVAKPYKTLSAALANLKAGDDVVMAPGTYREWAVVPKLANTTESTRIRAATPRTVVVKGSVEAAGWNAVSPGVYSIAWTGDQPEQVFRAGVSLKQIGGTVWGNYPLAAAPELSAPAPGQGGVWQGRVAGGVAELVTDSFTYDASSRRLYVKVATPISTGEKVEVSAYRHVLQAESVNRLTVEGIDFAHSNTTLTYRQGAVKIAGNNNLLSNLVVRDMDGQCVQVLGETNTLTNSTIERCGQVGITGSGKALTVTNNQVINNNTRRFDPNWEAGGMKFIGYGSLSNAVIRNNVVAYNNGDGIWFDWKNSNNLIEANTTAYNQGFGIHYEASQSATIRGNRSYGNALRGIYLLESSDCLLDGNSVFGNALEGIGIVDGGRSAGDAVLKPFNNRVVNNTMAWNDFNRNWIQLVLPGSAFRSTADGNTYKTEQIAPRMSMGFMSAVNPPAWKLDLWQSQTNLDAASNTQTVAIPADIKALIEARQLIVTSQLPSTLLSPGTF